MIKSLVTKFYSQKALKRIEAKVKKLGPNTKIDTSLFLSLRLFLTILIFILLLISNKYGYLISPIISIAFYILFEYILLDLKIKERGEILEKESLFFLEILTLSLEGGKNLAHALKNTVNNVNSNLSLEFKQTLEEVSLGKSLNESLEAMKERIPSKDLNNVILQMIQANSYGTNMVEAMHNQIEYLREKQMLNVKAKINKLPTKISVISVFFIVPIMLLIILAPVVLNFLLS